MAVRPRSSSHSWRRRPRNVPRKDVQQREHHIHGIENDPARADLTLLFRVRRKASREDRRRLAEVKSARAANRAASLWKSPDPSQISPHWARIRPELSSSATKIPARCAPRAVYDDCSAIIVLPEPGHPRSGRRAGRRGDFIELDAGGGLGNFEKLRNLFFFIFFRARPFLQRTIRGGDNQGYNPITLSYGGY